MKSQQTTLVGVLALSLCLACAEGKVVDTPGNGGAQGGGGPGNGGGGSGQGGTGVVVNVNLDAAPVLDPPDTRNADLPPDTKGCTQDDAGNYQCCPKPLSILSLGQPGATGKLFGKDTTNAFQAFMNSNTKGTATMDVLRKFTSIADLDLSKYDLIILQALEDSQYTGLWTFTDADAAALRDWVTKDGGAIITMSGYGGNITEIDPLNQLLNGSDKWSGISYNTDDTFKEDACTDNLCYCSYGSIPYSEWDKSCTECAAITVNHDGKDLGKAGVFRGRSINCTGSDCQVFAKDPSSKNLGVAKIIGKGRVLAWGDEWVTYTSQWGLEPDPDYDDAIKYAQCVGHTPMTSYSVPQFWYNIFRWAVPGNTCFTIVVPPTANVVQQVVY